MFTTLNENRCCACAKEGRYIQHQATENSKHNGEMKDRNIDLEIAPLALEERAEKEEENEEKSPTLASPVSCRTRQWQRVGGIVDEWGGEDNCTP